MKVYTPLEETSTYRDLYDSYNQTVDNLNDTDFLYESSLSDGRVFSSQKGYVNLQEGIMGQNITISAADLGNFKIRGFVYYTRKYNTYNVMDINCDLTAYKDNRPHFLYVLVQTGGTYEVYDNMQENTENRMLFARFVIDSSGDSIQFYLAAPFAGTPDYIKGNPLFEVTEGLDCTGNNNNTLTLAPGKIRFPGINFDNKSDPDMLTIDISDNPLPLRYVTWDSVKSRPTVDWSSNTTNNFNFGSKMNFETGAITSVANNKTTIQKVYFDPYTKTGVVEYGNVAYDTLEDAMKVLGTVTAYPLIDGIKYLIPVCAIVNKKGNDDLTDDTICSIVDLTPNEDLIFGLDQMSQQMALEAQLKAQQALTTANQTSGALTQHVNTTTNPHQVKGNQILKSDGSSGGIADELLGVPITTIYSNVATYINNNGSLSGSYLPKTGGTISGSLTITNSLTVSGSISTSSSLSVSGNTTVGGTLSVTQGAYLPYTEMSSNVVWGSSDIRGALYVGGYSSIKGVYANGEISTSYNYIAFAGTRLYLGVLPGDAPQGSYALYNS